ncbi:MAG: substrate-binding domain-containing protein [Desulfopila sp.]
MKRFLLAGLVAVAMCGAAHAEGIKVGVSFQEMNNEYFVVMNEALQEAVDSIGGTLYVTDAAHDVVKQTNDVEDLVSKGIKILIMNPTDSEGVRNAVEYAKKKGVVVVSVDAQAKGPIDSFVGSKNYDAGVLSCTALANELKGKGDVAILDGIPVVPILERVRGCKDALAKFPDIKLVDVQNGKQDRTIAMGVVENMIQAKPNLAGIFSVNDGGAMGVLAAIESSGKNIVLTSVDGSPEAISAILEGTAFKATAAQYPRDQVRIGFGVALAKYWGANVPAVIPVDVKLIDTSNAKGFSW